MAGQSAGAVVSQTAGAVLGLHVRWLGLQAVAKRGAPGAGARGYDGWRYSGSTSASERIRKPNVTAAGLGSQVPPLTSNSS